MVWGIGSILHVEPIELFLIPANAPVYGMTHIKEPLHVVAPGFLSCYLSGPLPYVRRHITTDENRPDLSRIPDFLFARFIFSGYGHHHISGSLNCIKNIFRIFFVVRPFSSMFNRN